MSGGITGRTRNGQRPAVPDRESLADLFAAEARIRFSHCDPAGIVYFPRWFDLMNGVVEDWFGQALGLSYRGFHEARRIGLGYAHAEADFLGPGFWDDAVEVLVQVERVGGASLALTLIGFRDAQALFRAHLVIVTTSLETRRAIPLPDDLRAAAESYRERAAGARAAEPFRPHSDRSGDVP